MKPIAFVLALSSIVATPAAQAPSSDLTAVRALYASADYDGALRLLAKANPDDDVVRVEEYRALCLMALGRTTEAERSIEQIFARQPMYALDPLEASPRMVALVAAVRQRLLPVLARNLYGLARKNLEHREYAAAVAQLTEMLAVVEAAGPEAGLEDLRILGGGFLELARGELAGATSPAAAATPATLALPPAASPSAGLEREVSSVLPTAVYSEFLKLADGQSAAARVPAPVTTSAEADAAPLQVRPDVYSDADRIQPPVPVQREVPRWTPPNEAARLGTHRGQVELVVDESGAVESASIAKSIHPAYDASLLEAARKWRYRPATRSGQRVRYRLLTEVVLRPPNP